MTGDFRARRSLSALWLALTLGLPIALSAQAVSNTDLGDKTLEQLMNIEITSVSRTKQKLSRTPAAVYVITQEDIQRSGATNIPDLLRMAPGVQVAQVDANRWAISVRGFNDIYSNKVLVLIDGRTVYTPGFSGVFWDQIDVPLDTIDRIEVVRGPGGSVWGANAVNGVINIITNRAQDTQGGRVVVGAGSAQTADDEFRYGGRAGQRGYYRIFGHYISYGDLPTPQGISGDDGWRMGHEGMRADWNLSGSDSLTLEADVFETRQGQTLLEDRSGALATGTGAVGDSGGDFLARWNHHLKGGSETKLQIYDNSYSRTDSAMRETENTVDVDFQQHLGLESRQDIVWGAGYRSTYNSLTNSSGMTPGIANNALGYAIAFQPPQRTLNLFSAFFQDEIALAKSLSLTLGAKVEHNAFTGFEDEPSVRLAWVPSNSQTIWFAASKAIRQPSRLDSDLQVNFQPAPLGNGLALTEQLLGNPMLESETMRDVETGYRLVPNNRVSADLTAFYSSYKNLAVTDLGSPFLDLQTGNPLLVIPFIYRNNAGAQDYGAEAALDFDFSKRWKLRGTYSWLKMNVHPYPAAPPNLGNLPAGFAGLLNSIFSGPSAAVLAEIANFNPSAATAEGGAPENQAGLRSYFNLTQNIMFDNSVYYVGGLRGRNIPAYVRLDSRLAWKINRKLEASLVGQNLLSPHHLEFGNVDQVVGTQVPRAILGRVIWSF
ncbi:MAG: TonB-dependent receptor plug domain-containing protein [Bryobacteraceae bacterium]